MIWISAQVFAGIGAAAKALPSQWPYLVAMDARIARCFQATINIQLCSPLYIRHWPMEDEWRYWSDTGVVSCLCLLPVQFKVMQVSDRVHDAWLYESWGRGSPWFGEPSKAELITTQLGCIGPGHSCAIGLERGDVADLGTARGYILKDPP